MRIWDRMTECLPLNRLRELQVKRLRGLVARCAECSPFYRKRLKRAGVNSDSIRALDDVRRLPFTTAADLESAYPAGLLCVSEEEISTVHAVATNSGGQCLGAYTRADMTLRADLAARLLAMAGVTKESVVQVALGPGLMAAAFGLHRGVECIGARLIPAYVGDKRREVRLITELDATHLVCTPRYALEVINAASAAGVKLGRTRLQAGVLGGEFWSERTRQRIESGLGVETYDHYGPMEILPEGVAAECRLRDGLHVFEDHFIAEVIDPETREPLPDGVEGELVLTTLTLEGCPVLRYRTGERTSITHHPCACGRTFARMARVAERRGGAFVVHGVRVFPTQIERVLREAAGRLPRYAVIHDCEHLPEDLELRIAVTEDLLSDEMRILRELEARVRKRFLSTLSLTVKVTFVEPGSLPVDDDA